MGNSERLLPLDLKHQRKAYFDVNITRVVIQNSTGFGLYGSNVLGNSIISGSTFKHNMYNYNGSQKYYGGNIRLSYWYCSEDASNSTLIIQSSYLLHGYNPYPNESNTCASGLSITFGLKCSNVVINITNTTARHNVGYAVGNLEIISYSSSITNSVYITQCVLEDGLVTSGNERGAGGLSITSELCFQPEAGDVSCSSNSTVHKHHVVTVTNTTFMNNTAVISGALVVFQEPRANVCVIRIIKFENCVFTNNTSTNGTPEVFFPPGTMNILTVFLAWVNLDLGIETCFYQDMDMYIKTWLQFAFPIYLWGISGLLIFLSNRFIAILRLLGGKPVHVLSTLFLLAYAKLQHTIIQQLYHSRTSVTLMVMWSMFGCTMPILVT